jgi:hypothetical protein
MSPPTDFVATAYIANGRLKLEQIDREALDAYLADLRDGEVELSVRRKGTKRSSQANRYLWGVVYRLLSEHTGYTSEEIHDWAKRRFIPKHVTFTDGNGEIRDDMVIGGSTTKLNTVDFTEFVENVRRFAATELGLDIPDPVRAWRAA